MQEDCRSYIETVKREADQQVSQFISTLRSKGCTHHQLTNAVYELLEAQEAEKSNPIEN